MLIEDELCTEQLEYASHQIKEIWRIACVDDVKTLSEKYDPGQDERDRERNRILEEVAANPRQLGERVSVDADTLDALVEPGPLPSGTDHGYPVAGPFER
jgi:hypothetical protein